MAADDHPKNAEMKKERRERWEEKGVWKVSAAARPSGLSAKDMLARLDRSPVEQRSPDLSSQGAPRP